MRSVWSILAICWVVVVTAQTPDLGPNYIGDEGKPPLPPTTILNGSVVELDTLSHVIALRQSSAQLICADGRMDIALTFKQPFNGIVYANYSRHSPCTSYGSNTNKLAVSLPLHGCGTVNGPARVFTNNINIRFHPQLERDDDEVVTVVCRYPPPVAEPPLAGLPYVSLPPPAPIKTKPVLSAANIIFIICALLFLGLLLLGLAFGYTCLRRRRISLIKKVPPPSLPPSELSQFSMPFDGLKIPRAQTMIVLDDVTSSETLPSSDYPSETPSEVDDVDMGHMPPVNRAYMLTEEIINQSYMDEQITEEQLSRQLITTDVHDSSETQRSRAMIHHEEEMQQASMNETSMYEESAFQETAKQRDASGFSSHLLVHPPPPVSRAATSDSEAALSEVDAQYSSARHVETSEHMIDEEIRDSVTKNIHDSVTKSIHDSVSETKMLEDIERRRQAVRKYYERQQQTPPPGWDVEVRHQAPDHGEASSSHWDDSSIGTEVPQLPGMYSTSSERYLEDSRAYKSQALVKSARDRTPPVPPRTAASRHYSEMHMQMLRESTDIHEETDSYAIEEPIRPTRRDVPSSSLPPAMEVLIRVLDAPRDYDDRLSVLTDEDRSTLRELITHEHSFREMLTEARVSEDLQRIRYDSRYAGLLSQHKWNVVLRVLAPPLLDPAPSEFSEDTRRSSDRADFTDVSDMTRESRRRRQHRSDRQQLDALDEYEAKGAHEHLSRSAGGSSRSHVTSKSSYGGDVRSVTEETVDFHRYAPSLPDDTTGTSGGGGGGSGGSGGSRGGRTSRSAAQLAQEWSALPVPPASSREARLNAASSSSHHFYQAESTTMRSAAPSTVGDREEMYSVAETDVDWQRY